MGKILAYLVYEIRNFVGFIFFLVLVLLKYVNEKIKFIVVEL